MTFLKKKAEDIINIIKEFEVTENDRKEIEELFYKLDKAYTKPGLALKGSRTKENISQKKLANLLGIPQSNVSEMENGKRSIGKKMARRLSKILNIHYKVFL